VTFGRLHEITHQWELPAVTSAAANANQSAKQVAQSEPFKIGARVGILSWGVTHVVIAWLALQIAFGQNERADQTGAFQSIAQHTGGKVLLWILFIGFVFACLWRLSEALWGYTYVQDKKKNIRKRATSAGKAVLFAVLAYLAVSTAVGSGGGGQGKQGATATVMGWPGGQFLVGLVGLIIIAAGAYKMYKGWKRKFEDDMDLPSDPKARKTAVRLGQVGFIGRGFATALIGVLVILSAITFDPQKANGLDPALKALAAEPYGMFLLILVSLGLLCYGAFLAFDARYHRV
jgi:uncharacterized protein DUF1206